MARQAPETPNPPVRAGFWLVRAMRPAGFEPATHGLEGRRSSTELRARLGSVARYLAGSSAEVGGDDRRRAVAVDARGGGRVARGGADRAPARVQRVRAVRRAREPELQRTCGADVGRG